MQSIFMFVGGLGLFLFGMKMMSEGLQKMAGKMLPFLLRKATANSFSAFFIGIIVTMIVQSSSITTIMVVGFVNARLINLIGALGIIIGANVGTAISSQIIAFQINSIIPLFLFWGSTTYLFFKQEKIKNIGFIILGISILFFGMNTMGLPLQELSEKTFFQDWVMKFENPFLAFLIGLILTAIIQSSSAIIGIIVAMYFQGIYFPFATAVFIILGSNIGTCVDTMIASITGNRESKRAAIAHLLYNLITCLSAAIIITIFPLSLSLIQDAWPNEARQVVMFHTLFNIIGALVFLPFIKIFSQLIIKIFPEKKTSFSNHEWR